MILIKKIVTALLVVLVVLTIGIFSVNYIFDKIFGKDLMNQVGISDILEENSNDTSQVEKNNQDNSTNVNDDINEPSDKSDGNFNVDEEINLRKVKEIEEQLTTVEKAKVINLVTSNISIDEIKTLSSLASGGVGKDELQQIKQILLDKVSSEEIAYLKSLYDKYNN